MTENNAGNTLDLGGDDGYVEVVATIDGQQHRQRLDLVGVYTNLGGLRQRHGDGGVGPWLDTLRSHVDGLGFPGCSCKFARDLLTALGERLVEVSRPPVPPPAAEGANDGAAAESAG